MVDWSYGEAHDGICHYNCSWILFVINASMAVSSQVGRQHIPLRDYYLIGLGKLGPIHTRARETRTSCYLSQYCLKLILVNNSRRLIKIEIHSLGSSLAILRSWFGHIWLPGETLRGPPMPVSGGSSQCSCSLLCTWLTLDRPILSLLPQLLLGPLMVVDAIINADVLSL